MDKKLWWTVGTLPLVATPVAIVASCATTLTPAQAIAEVLHQENKVSFKSGKGTYGDAEITKFTSNKASFLNEIDFNVENKDQFTFEIAEFNGKSEENNKTYFKFKVKVTDTKNTNDNATSQEIKLEFEYKNAAASDKVQAKVVEAEKAANKTFKIKEGLNLNSADFAMISGISNIKDLEKINPNLLDHLFTGVVKGDQDVKLSIAKFNVAKTTTKTDQNFTITMQLKYTDAKGDNPTSLTTKELVFTTTYSDAAITPENIFATWAIVNEQKWLQWTGDGIFPKGDITKDNFTKPEKTNFQALINQFFPTGWTYEIDTWSVDETIENSTKTKVTFALKVTGADKQPHTDTQAYNLTFTHNA